MENKLREFIEDLFTSAPCTQKAVEMKQEILQNLLDKYRDLVNEGKNEQDAYNAAIVGLGDINTLIAGLGGNFRTVDYTIERQSAILKAVAVSLYILCVVPCIILGLWGVVLMFVMVAVATALLIYNKSITTSKAVYMNKQPKEKEKEKEDFNPLHKAVLGAFWTVVVAIYFIVSIFTMAWHITWLLFLIGAAIENIIKIIFSLEGKK